jgi:hypothetical protein
MSLGQLFSHKARKVRTGLTSQTLVNLSKPTVSSAVNNRAAILNDLTSFQRL